MSNTNTTKGNNMETALTIAVETYATLAGVSVASVLQSIQGGNHAVLKSVLDLMSVTA